MDTTYKLVVSSSPTNNCTYILQHAWHCIFPLDHTYTCCVSMFSSEVSGVFSDTGTQFNLDTRWLKHDKNVKMYIFKYTQSCTRVRPKACYNRGMLSLESVVDAARLCSPAFNFDVVIAINNFL